jgi:hypothetical protein
MSWWSPGTIQTDKHERVDLNRLALELLERQNARLHEDLQRALSLIESMGNALLELKRDGMVIEPREPSARPQWAEDDDNLPAEIEDAIEDQQFRLAQKRQVRAWARTAVREAGGDEGKLAEIEKRIRDGVDYEGGEAPE